MKNLVLADSCNTAWRDHLPGLAHVARWAHRLALHGDHLAAVSEAGSWESDPGRSLAIARAAYAHLLHGTLLWSEPDEFRQNDPALVVAVLADLPPTTVGQP